MARRLGVEPAALLAVAEVESGGQVFTVIDGKNRPLIRWEGHYFDERLSEAARTLARNEGLASPIAGGIANPSSQVARYRLFERASKINPQAAIESVSWGLGQVMGAHWRTLGYARLTELLADAFAGAAGQIELMVRYIEKFGLVDELQRLDFTAFARGYNGPAFKKNAYHTKMAAAYERYTGRAPVSAATGMLRMGSKGAKVRELQALLVRAGYPVKVDGDFGTSTKNAVRAFQATNKITVDGVAGPETMRILHAFRQSPDDRPGEIPVSQIAEVKNAGRGGVVVGFVAALRDQVADTANHLLGIDATSAQMAANALLAASGVIGVGLTIYAVLGWWRSRKTDEGDVPA